MKYFLFVLLLLVSGCGEVVESPPIVSGKSRIFATESGYTTENKELLLTEMYKIHVVVRRKPWRGDDTFYLLVDSISFYSVSMGDTLTSYIP